MIMITFSARSITFEQRLHPSRFKRDQAPPSQLSLPKNLFPEPVSPPFLLKMNSNLKLFLARPCRSALSDRKASSCFQSPGKIDLNYNDRRDKWRPYVAPPFPSLPGF